MYLDILERVRLRFVDVVEELFSIRLAPPGLGFPPNVDLGEISITNCFELAKRLRQAPRKIAESVAARLLPIEGVERLSVAGPGYLNLYLDRVALAVSLYDARVAADQEDAERREFRPEADKVLVEHTSINPNKAAHVGHLRNAVLGDTFARLLRFIGREVEVQNYIDNTGVQVADVVVGFAYLEKKSAAEVRALTDDPSVRFDYYCWDLYARVTQTYQQDSGLASRRADTLKAIEEGYGELAAMAEVISTAILRLHLETVLRLGIRYDLLVQESEILRLNFWKYAFTLLQERGALRFEDSGKNKGCWVMSLAGDGAADVEGANEHEKPSSDDSAAEAEEDDEQDVKIIVRSNGTVTYVGKDIAYHLWKFGLLGRDFGYEPFYEYPGGHRLWRTSSGPAPSDAPAFGRASAAYVVIDSRQSYLQRVVAAAFRELGYHDQAANMHHFAYEFWNLSLDAAASLGIEPGPEDRQKGYVEISGRRGLGVKADDLIDAVIAKALAEVQERQKTADPAFQKASAYKIGVAALRYFLLKFTRRSMITFDFKDALAFEGETGPYLQYSAVRARNIYVLSGDESALLDGSFIGTLKEGALTSHLRDFLGGNDDFWRLVVLAAQLEMAVEHAVTTEEPAVVAKYAFRLAQAFNNFYHHHRVLTEPDASRLDLLVFLVYLVRQTLVRALGLLGIEVPERM